MFKNLVRSERYLITAVLYMPKNMDTKMVSFLSSGAGTAMLDDLDKRGYRVFCVSLNFELNVELTNTYSCKPANSLLELMKRDLRLISEPHIYIAGYCDRNASEWQMVKNAAMFQLPTPEIPAPFCRLYDEQGSDEEDWFAAASFSPRSDNDGSKHPVFVDDGFGKPVLASDVIQNRDGEFSSRCSTSKELFDFNVEVAQNR